MASNFTNTLGLESEFKKNYSYNIWTLVIWTALGFNNSDIFIRHGNNSQILLAGNPYQNLDHYYHNFCQLQLLKPFLTLDKY